MPSALHPKAAYFVRQNLLSGVEKFTEIEARISALADEKSCGDAFEVFAEAYLATQRKYDTTHVWPLSAAPTETLQTLALRSQDCGVDGIFKTLLGHFSAYQVKFRSNRPSLTWRELSTFMGLADSQQIRSRVLITNCDDLPSILNERQGFFCIRGSDLDRLEAQDFRAIEAWLADTEFVAAKKQPRPHQSRALDSLIPAFEKQDRVTAIMACGTGKTLVALWVAEKLQARRILVLLPSLALLRQVLHEWLRESSLPDIAYLCVCSDPTVKDGVDAISTLQSDLDFEVSTESSRVREFLDAAFNGTKIIFSTYQSASVVGEALKPGEPFDFAVFDEAHKTAGREGRNFAFALDDACLPIRKRLFLTATPRHYNPLDRDREGEAKLVLSMDNPAVYGEQAFKLTFAEAARLGIICRYKVLISVITSDEVNNELLTRGEVLVNGETIRAREVANHIALRNAVKNHGTRHIFTFHRTVRDARDFVEPEQGIGGHLEDFSLFHVNGNMSAAQRERVMRDFRDCERGLISNARCLTEGVDVPAVDMVAFLSPRRSLVDIVQAIGRAMRTSPSTGKEFGYVLVPLFIDIAQGESIEDAVARAQFDEVWDVIQTLQEQDEALAELIQQMAESKGRSGKFDASGLEMIEFCGENVAIQRLTNSISTRVFDELFANWDVRYGELIKFKEKNGHCRVTLDDKAYCPLAKWVCRQREFYSKGQLPNNYIAKLERLGFEWDPLEKDWQEAFDKLFAFKSNHGHCRVPENYQEKSLCQWVKRQRQIYFSGRLSHVRRDQLNSINFDWNPIDEKWLLRYEELKRFKFLNVHCNVPQRCEENKALGQWVQSQRRYYFAGKLEEDRTAKLENLGFEWNPLDREWETKFDELVAFKSESGHMIIPVNCPRTSKLRIWTGNQRQLYRKGKLSHDRIVKLEEIGFQWEPIDAFWEEKHAELIKYKNDHGHCDVKIYHSEYSSLYNWLNRQRKFFRSGKLSEERIKKLEDLGMVWELADAWLQSYEELLNYKNQHGHCNVPQTKKSAQLGAWVNQQRFLYKKENLIQERVLKLDSIGFEWDPTDCRWQQFFDELKKFKDQFGHCRVPQKTHSNSLGKWVSHQRQNYAKGRLQIEKIGQLESLNFDWNPNDTDWKDLFEELKVYKQEHGDCNVPRSYSKNRKLALWVKIQRDAFRKNKLSDDRKTKLQSIGFSWSLYKYLDETKS
jgi:superfamily II DNA or RNA helicase